MKNKSFLIIACILIILVATVGIFWNNITSNKQSSDLHSTKSIVTVGGSEADIPGYTSDDIQAAMDRIKAQGGGTVKLNPGT